MKKAGKLYFYGTSYCLMLFFLMLVFFLLLSNMRDFCSSHSILGSNAYGHLTEAPGVQSDVMSKSIGSYVVLFQTSPSLVRVSDNSTLLRFSITQNNQDTYGVFAALTIKEKRSGNISAQFPYNFYEFGDIDFRHTFQNAVDHQVILQARIAGDQQYQNNPLVASFDVPVRNLVGITGTFAEIIFILTLVGLAVGIVILILDFNKRMKRASTPK